MTLVFVTYMLLLPVFISYDEQLTRRNFYILFAFDILFMVEKAADLFVGSYRDDGSIENKLGRVIQKNYSNKVLEEVFYSFGPFLLNLDEASSLIYAAFKVPRYFRLFEMDKKIDDVVEYYAETRTVSEVKSLEGVLDVLKFLTTTLINLHFLTCM